MKEGKHAFAGRLGYMLRGWRMREGMTLKELARSFGGSRATMYGIEKGLQTINIFQFALMAKKLKLDRQEILSVMDGLSRVEAPKPRPISLEEAERRLGRPIKVN